VGQPQDTFYGITDLTENAKGQGLSSREGHVPHFEQGGKQYLLPPHHFVIKIDVL